MGLEHQGPVGNGIPFSPSTRLHPPLSSMNKTFKIFDTCRATWCMACVAGNYWPRKANACPPATSCFLARQGGAHLSFCLLTHLFFTPVFLRNIIAYSNNLVQCSIPDSARTWPWVEVTETQHGLAGQHEVGYRDFNLLVDMVLARNFTTLHSPLAPWWGRTWWKPARSKPAWAPASSSSFTLKVKDQMWPKSSLPKKKLWLEPGSPAPIPDTPKPGFSNLDTRTVKQWWCWWPCC